MLVVSRNQSKKWLYLFFSVITSLYRLCIDIKLDGCGGRFIFFVEAFFIVIENMLLHLSTFILNIQIFPHKFSSRAE